MTEQHMGDRDLGSRQKAIAHDRAHLPIIQRPMELTTRIPTIGRRSFSLAMVYKAVTILLMGHHPSPRLDTELRRL